MDVNPLSTTLPTAPRADFWHRALCPVTANLVLSGDLAYDRDQALEQLRTWCQAGITHIVDVRSEESHDWFMALHAPHITYHWLGVDDDGTPRDATWFDAGVGAIHDAWADPTTKVLVHCQMGINRGPSMGYAAMLANGWHPVEALEAIRRARPIAAVCYATDAVRWWMTKQGASRLEMGAALVEVNEWLNNNGVHVSWSA